MKIDLHTHGKLAKDLPFSPGYTRQLFEEASLAGLDALCLTEHFNTSGFEILYEYIGEEMLRSGDCFIFQSLKIFPGMEIEIKEGGHILAIGSLEQILSLHAALKPWLEYSDSPSFSELLSLLRPYPLLVGAAHPYRAGGHIPELPDNLLKQLNFVELNGKDAAFNLEAAQAQSRALGSRLNLPVAAGSDTHQLLQFGCINTELEEECRTIEKLRRLIESEAYKINISPSCALKVKSAGMLKKALKKIHKLGGDYSAII